MVKNKHKGMDLKRIWFKKGEFKELVNSIEGNYEKEAFNILHKIKQRGDLEL